jgi:hypothetical protein
MTEIVDERSPRKRLKDRDLCNGGSHPIESI